MKYLCKIRYVGTHFCGFQVQPGRRTVQGVLNEVADRVFECPVRVTGCSRTDSGVHAEGFCLTLEPSDGVLRIPPEKLSLAMQPFLPPDLSLYEARTVEDGFHPRYDAVSKEYKYLIYHNKIMNPFLANRVWQAPHAFVPDALERMNLAAAYLIGEHDFSAFRSEGSPTLTAVRTVHDCRITHEGDLYTLTVSADGFLYNMVRIITGTMVAVAAGRILPEQVKSILASKNRAGAGATAPPDGLYLNRVVYDEADYVKKVR